MTVASLGVLDLGGFSNSIGALSGSGTITNNSDTSRNATLTVNVPTSATSNFSGTIQNGTGVLALTKAGRGTLTLSGSSSYTGGTSINAGALSLDNADAIGAEGAISFGGGTLQ